MFELLLASIEQLFDTGKMSIPKPVPDGRAVDGAALRAIVERTKPVSLAKQQCIPVLGELETIFATRQSTSEQSTSIQLNNGGIPRGSVVELGGVGATTLALALLAGATRTGSWVATIGFDQLGWEAALELGVSLDQVAAIRSPPEKSLAVVAALIDAFDVVLCGPDVALSASELRRLQSRARERGAVLMRVCRSSGATSLFAKKGVRNRSAETWPIADIRLKVEQNTWQSLHEGWGYLGGRHMSVVVDGRRAMNRRKQIEIYFDKDGQLEHLRHHAEGNSPHIDSEEISLDQAG